MDIVKVRRFIKVLYGDRFTARSPNENRLGSYTFDYLYLHEDGKHRFVVLAHAVSPTKLLWRIHPDINGRKGTTGPAFSVKCLIERMKLGYEPTRVKINYNSLPKYYRG